MDPSERIDAYINGLADWRGQTLAGLRKLILEAEPGLVEEWKWSSYPHVPQHQAPGKSRAASH